MNRTITHKHLKRQFDNFEVAEDLDGLFAELEFSTLLLPVFRENGYMGFPILSFGDEDYAPVFTDIFEFQKANLEGDPTLMANDFEIYLGFLDLGLDGIIIDVEGERFPLPKKITELIKPNPSFNPIQLTLDEVIKIRNSVDNSELEDFISDESNLLDYDGLMNLLSRSDIFTVVLSKGDLKDNAKDGVLQVCDVGELPLAVTSNMGESYALVYSSEDEIWQKDNPLYPYSQLVSLPEFVHKALLCDMDGIILNENSQNIRIPREYLIRFFKNLENPDTMKYEDYAFILGYEG